MFIFQFAILIYSVVLHEISHGRVADYLGDPTARLAKRLTLDPRPHIDPVMTILLPLLLILTGSPVIFGAAKPVPVDSFNFREPQKDLALTAAAGPVTNILIALFISLILRLTDIIVINVIIRGFIQNLAFYAIHINVFLAVFNLLPLPPLDGFKVVAGLLPDNYARAWLSLERFGLTIIILALFLFGPVINSLVYPVSATILKILLW